MKKIFAFLFILISLHSTYSQVEQDKVLHFLGGNLYGLVGAGVASQISDGDRTWTFIGAIGGSLLIGLAKESIDQKQYGGWDNADLLATVLGGATVGVTIDIFKKRKQRKRDKLFKDAVSYSELEIKKTFLIENAEINSLSLLGMSKAVMER
ncbi:hypothetical protein SAMN04488008_107127 [Maribacter orientalis]|uniref:Uncharacterized protein n=1 Tax=Maribacter orientalis TaxID=228957 RepID=A0A1H7UHN6_9FLAO|nr:hypothetical protein [Maribacter orientalis]SEL96570.1 hypothetical protein SAMN04488008_107127 [Maribacter orientalis]